ncbi:cobaltochelatase subunit CobN, partial [uncultured Duncaniella sp.]
MKGGAGDASGIPDVVRNTYGWNVMKPDVIDNELWNDIYDTYIADKHN